MKTLYIDCGMGAAGDMLTAALLELLPDPEGFTEELNHLGIPEVTYRPETSFKCGIKGTHMHVMVNGEEEDEHMHEHSHDHVHMHDHEHEHHDHDHEHTHDHDHEHHHDHDHEHEHHHDHDHEHEHTHDHDHDHGHHHHHHTGMHAIEHLVNDHLQVSDKVKKDILAVYGLIAEAESKVHGVPVSEIHFHEVGTMDALADVTAVCLLMDRIHPDQVIASPVHVGSGTVRCAHGILPVPAPATELILQGIPVYSRQEIRGELCTPTGAALLKHFVTSFGEMPVMKVQASGYGMGTKDFPVANCVRALLGETGSGTDGVVELCFNVDDMTGEEIGYAFTKLMEAGARDVFTVPVQMKKNRPATLINVVCSEKDREKILQVIFTHTTTIGAREVRKTRYVLDRKIETVETGLGTFRRKHSSGYGVEKYKYEFDDLAAAAEKEGCSVRQILEKLKQYE